MSAAHLPQLTDKQAMFVRAYLAQGKNKHATNAALEAGCSPKSAHVQASRWLSDAKIRAHIEEAQGTSPKKLRDMNSRVLKELRDMAFANIGDLITIDEDGQPQIDFSRATPKQLKAVTSVQTKKRILRNSRGEQIGEETTSRFTMADKYRGLELLARNLGLLKEQEVKVTVDVADRLLAARSRVVNGGYLAHRDGGEAEDVGSSDSSGGE